MGFKCTITEFCSFPAFEGSLKINDGHVVMSSRWLFLFFFLLTFFFSEAQELLTPIIIRKDSPEGIRNIGLLFIFNSVYLFSPAL